MVPDGAACILSGVAEPIGVGMDDGIGVNDM